MPYVRAWADNSRQSLLRLTTSAAPVDMLTLSGGGAECAYGAGFLAGWSDSGSRPRLSIAGAVAAILMIPTALSAQVGGAVNRTPPTPFLDSY